jgi:hypothetical protein
MKKLFVWAVILFALTACSDIQPIAEVEQSQPAESQQPIIFTATIHAGAPTKGLTAGTDKITAEWVVGEKVALLYQSNGSNRQKVVAEVKSVNTTTKAATIYAELTGTLTEGDEIPVTLVYPATAVSNYELDANVLKSQDGTFESVSSKLDVRTGTGTLLIGSDKKANLKKDVTLNTLYSIFLFTLTKSGGGTLSASSLEVTINSKTYTITPPNSGSKEVMYVVLPPIDHKAVSFKAVSGGVNYYFSNPSVSFGAGKYYASDLVMSTDFGLLPGIFTVDEHGKKVQFSKGNLQWFYGENAHKVDQSSYVSPGTQNQYHFSGGIFTFADHQYDICAGNNDGIDRGSDAIESNKGSYDANKRIDLFMYATSGYKSTNNTSDNQTYHYKPFAIYRGRAYESIQNPVNLEFGPMFGIAGDGNIKKSDWGVFNAILNGGDETGMWRTLTYNEWYYLLNTRDNASEKIGVGKVNGCHGVIILPDSWTLPGSLTFTPISAVDGNTYVSVTTDNKSLNYNWSDNTYSSAEWALMEASGAVFLPAAGAKMNDTDGTVKGDNDGTNEGYVISYWTASTSVDGSSVSREYAYAVDLGQESATVKNWRFDKSNRACGRAVRLVRNVQ